MTDIIKMQKRMELAAEVLSQLAAEKIIAVRGNYLFIDHDPQMWGQPIELFFGSVSNFIDRVKKAPQRVCHVCAQGALVMAHFAVNEPVDKAMATLDKKEDVMSPSAIYDILGNAFEKKQLQMIEAAYEGNVFDFQDSGRIDLLSEEELELCEKWNMFQYSQTDRKGILEAVFKNILRNDGVFRPDTDL